jgi:hypothetical protein
MNESTAATITEQPRRRGDPIARCVNDLLSANAHGPGNLDMPALRRLLEFPKPDADIVLRHVFEAIKRGRGRATAGCPTALRRLPALQSAARGAGARSPNRPTARIPTGPRALLAMESARVAVA